MTVEARIRLLVADDQEVVRLGVKKLVEGTEIKVVREATTGTVAAKLALEKEVDVALLDVLMPGGDGLIALGRIKLDKPDMPVLMFSGFQNSASVAKAFALGASGFLPKTCSKDELLDAIRVAARGESVWDRQKLKRLSIYLRSPLSKTLEACLSEREAGVLRFMVQGLTNKQIAVETKIGCETVKEHVQQILRKLGLTDRTQAALWAVRHDAA